MREAFQPTLPSVNLLPDKVRQGVALTKVRRRFTWAVALLAVIVAAVWTVQVPAITAAQDGLDSAHAKNDELQQRIEALGPIEQMVTQLQRQQALVTSTLASQPQASAVFDHVTEAAATAGSAITFPTMDISYHGIPRPGGVLNPCPNPDPFGAEVTVGCVTFGGKAATRQEVAEFLRALEADAWFVGPYVSSSTTAVDESGRTTVVFTGTVGVGPAALQTPLSAAEVSAIVNPGKPKVAATTPASPQPEPGG